MMLPNSPARYIGYARLSEASEASTSIARQHEIIAQTAAARGGQLIDIVDDPEASATRLRLDRPGLSEVRRRVKDGEADAVLVWRLDRIARSVVDFGTLLDEGLNIVSCTEPLDTTTPMGRAMAEILQVFAAMEARTIALRVSASVDYLRRNHRWPGGQVPYGYRTVPHPDGVGRALEPDPEQAKVVRELVDRILAGESVYAITNDLNRRGVPTPRRGKAQGWGAATVKRIVTGDAVLGRVRSRGELVRDEHGLPETVWQPLITVEEHERLRARYAASSTGRLWGGSRRTDGRLLSGIIVCGTCGGKLYAHRPGKNYSAFYTCRASVKGRVCDAPTSITCDRVEEWIEDWVLARFGPIEVVEVVVTTPDPVGMLEVEQALQDTAREMTMPGADVAALADRMSRLHARREQLAAQPVVPTTTEIATGRTFAEEWHASDTPRRRALLASRIAAVEVAPVPPKQRTRKFQPERLTVVTWPDLPDADDE